MPSKTTISIILGTTRQGRTSDKVAAALVRMLNTRTDISLEILDLREYQLPLLDESVTPARRKIIADPHIKRWSDKIAHARAFIFVIPEYNRGYPAVFKNALDVLYAEWNNKPVGFVGYSGGGSGGSFALASLHPVMDELKMHVVDREITIPTVWKAFDAEGNLLDAANIGSALHAMVDQLVARAQ